MQSCVFNIKQISVKRPKLKRGAEAVEFRVREVRSGEIRERRCNLACWTSLEAGKVE